MMLTVLGIFSMMGSLSMGVTAVTMEWKGKLTWITIALELSYITGMVACLVLAYLCFGGEF